jgi:trehalose 6-phosphate synthase
MPGVIEDQSGASGRLLLISNRLPITIKRSEDGQYSFSMSSGGLVTGLSGLSKATSFQWYGWPGLEVPEAEAGPMRQQLKEKYNAIPVFVDDDLADRHYNGFASASCVFSCFVTAPFPRSLTMRDTTRLDSLAPLPLPPRRDHL